MTDNTGFVADLEKQVLGAILSGDDHSALFAMLEDRHFVDPVHQVIYQAAKQAHAQYSSSKLTVTLKLIADDFIADFKSKRGFPLATYMAECTSATLYSAGTAAKGARNVIAQWARLELATEAGLVSDAARSPEADPAALIKTIGSVLDTIASDLRQGKRGKTRVPFRQAAGMVFASAREAREKKGLTGITSGLADVDRSTGGFQRRDLTLIGARPSMGKTTLGSAIALSAAKSGAGVGFFSLEMDTSKVVTRMCSDLAHRRDVKIPYENVLNGSATENDLQTLEWAMEEFLDLPLWVEDAAGLSIVDIRIKTEAMIAEAEQAGFTIDMLVFDHLGKIRPSSRYAGNKVHEIGEITEGIKELAREYNLSAILLSQLNRAVEQRDNKRPMLSDLRDSGAIEQDADTIMFLYREAYYLAREKPESYSRQIERDADLSGCINKGELEIAKQRNGRIQTIELFMDLQYSAVRNAAREGYADIRGQR